MDDIPDRLEALRISRKSTWKELGESLGVGVAMVHFMRSGRRHPSLKLLGRIEELERESKPFMGVKEEPSVYSHSLPSVDETSSKADLVAEIQRLKADIEMWRRTVKNLLDEADRNQPKKGK